MPSCAGAPSCRWGAAAGRGLSFTTLRPSDRLFFLPAVQEAEPAGRGSTLHTGGVWARGPGGLRSGADPGGGCAPTRTQVLGPGASGGVSGAPTREARTSLRNSSSLWGPFQNVALLEEEADNNQLTEFFSYEHFYVIYCKFWELDADHDLLIDPQDLARHNDHGEWRAARGGHGQQGRGQCAAPREPAGALVTTRVPGVTLAVRGPPPVRVRPGLPGESSLAECGCLHGCLPFVSHWPRLRGSRRSSRRGPPTSPPVLERARRRALWARPVRPRLISSPAPWW